MSDVEKNIGTHKPEFAGEWVRLGDVIKKAKSARCGSDSYPILSITMRDGTVEQASRFKKSIASRDTGNYKVVEPGQLVVGFPIDEGVIYVQNFNYPGIMSPAYDVWDIDSSRVDPSYLELALHSPQSMDYYRSNLRGTTARRRSLPTNTLCDLTFPLPSLENQRIVVKRMSMIATLLDDAGSRLSALDDLVKSQFVEMFGDVRTNPHRFEKCCLRDVARGKLSYGSSCSSVPYDGMTRYLRITDITDDGSLNDDVRSPSDVSDKYLLNDGDLLFARSGATVGKTYRYKKDDGRAIYAGYLIRLVPNTDLVLPDYLFWYTKTDFYSSFVANAQRAVAQPNINAQEYASLELLVPPLDDQRRFVSFATRVDKLGFDSCGDAFSACRLLLVKGLAGGVQDGEGPSRRGSVHKDRVLKKQLGKRGEKRDKAI